MCYTTKYFQNINNRTNRDKIHWNPYIKFTDIYQVPVIEIQLSYLSGIIEVHLVFKLFNAFLNSNPLKKIA